MQKIMQTVAEKKSKIEKKKISGHENAKKDDVE